MLKFILWLVAFAFLWHFGIIQFLLIMLGSMMIWVGGAIASLGAY